MPDVLEAECKYTGGKVFEGQYGDYTDAVFVHNGEEIKVFGDKGTDLFDALCEVQKGETYTLIDKDGSYKLADSQVESLINGGGGTSQPQNGTQPQGVSQEVDPQTLAKEHARLIANTYAYLDKQFAEKQDNVNQMPTPAELQKMAVSAAIEAVR